MEIQGEVADIIYKNEVNSYLIATFEMEEELTTIVGYLPFVNSGDNLRLIGNFVEHKEYGRQFKVETFEKIMPQTLDALEKYLASGNIKQIGEATAKKIISKFGKDTIDVLKYEYEKLAQIKGISLNKAKEMSDSFIENWEVWQIVGFLDKFGIGAEYAKKVFDLYGVNAIQEIENNPYLLMDITRGADFKQIDKMALNLGIEDINEKRIKCGIKYGIILATNNGHCCVLEDNLKEFVRTLLNVNEDIIENNLIALKMENQIVIENREGSKWVYLYSFFKAEEDIAKKIIQLKNAKNTKKIIGINSQLKKIEASSCIELSEKQKETIKVVNENNVVIITGGPGTGKTTIIKAIIDIYEEKKKKVILCAPTGRAAKKMTQTTGREASTLHRLLEIGKINEDNLYNLKNDYEGAPIDADVIIVDELSMVDMFLMNYLLKCIYQGTKLILVGDYDQLPSVGPGSILKDFILSDEIPTVHLDKIFRQAAKSKIIINAHRVNNGKMFLSKKCEDEQIMKDSKEDFFFISEHSQDRMIAQVVSLCTGRLKKFGNYDFFENIQVLTPTKKGNLGTKELNKVLQQALNPNTNNAPQKNNGGAVYRCGDRIMQIKNNYDMYWEKEGSKNNTGSGVFNGEMGTITNINNLEKTVKIKFDDEKVAWYEFSELDQIEHSYAVTIHKAQRK